MIRKILVNRILFVIVPVFVFTIIYFRYKLGLDGFKIDLLDIFIFLIIIGIHWSVSSIKKVLKLRSIRNNKMVEGMTKISNVSKINYPYRASFVEYDVIITHQELEIYRGKKIHFTVNKSKRVLKFNSLFFKRNIFLDDIKFLLLEYHLFHEYTFRGWMSRGQFDNLKYQNTISIVLNSGQIVEVFSGSLEESVYESNLTKLTENPYGELPEEQTKNYLGIGERAVNLLCQELNLKYLIIEYPK